MNISIHALLAESDYTDLNSAYGALISIHALLAESDLWVLMGGLSYNDFYPRSPCGERRFFRGFCVWLWCISIHALLAESDEQAQDLKIAAHGISIHALLAESDL